MLCTEHLLAAEFGAAAPEHYRWRTGAPLVARRERDLVRAVFLPLGGRVLDLGCGEGATLFHLDEPEGAVGVDLFESKLAFARTQLKRCRFVEGSGYALPFPDGAFDHVIARDVIHHIDDPRRVLDECLRVLAPDGRIDLLEPSRYNPLIVAHALAKPAERGELRSTKRFLTETLAGSGFEVISAAHYQALPLHRLLLHPEIGNRSLRSSAFARGVVESLERTADRVIPRIFWAYVHVRARGALPIEPREHEC